jgi:signal transduction histidine kinase
VVAAADAERRRIERDLHDGTQQRLVAIRLELGEIAERFDQDSEVRADLLRIRQTVEEALDELRDLAHGLFPPLLASDGLYAALDAAARQAPLPVVLDGDSLPRLPRAVETSVYFSCLEALQNVSKHAGSGAQAVVRLRAHDGALEFRVSDDGCGFDVSRTPSGDGITNLRDRLEAVGGYAEIDSQPGRGTTVFGWLPVSDSDGLGSA